jgi:hypothetical protein
MADRLWKLYIYDKDSDIDRDQAAGRFDDDMRLLTYPVEGGYGGLIDTMDEILKGGFVFDRVLFQTHGDPGGIYFRNNFVGKLSFEHHFGKYSALFPHFTRIYFDGCNVAEGGDGTDFLIGVGATLLTQGGGDVMGWTTLGHGVSGWVPFIGGHTLHFGGSDTFKRVRFYPGGEPDFPDSWLP